MARRRRTVLLVGVVVATATIVLVLLPRPIAEIDIGSKQFDELSASEQSQAVNDVRSTLVQVIAAVAVGLAGVVAWQQLGISREQSTLASDQLSASIDAQRQEQELARRALTGQRLTESADQLGHDKVAVRVAGVHGLELVVRDSPAERDLVIGVLAAFVRDPTAHAPGAPAERLPVIWWNSSELDHRTLGAREADRQAALHAIGRLVPQGLDDKGIRELTDHNLIDLRGGYLDRSDLSRGCFDGARFGDADLRGSNLSEASARRADFTFTALAGANLAHLEAEFAVFDNSDLREADFTGAKLCGAVFDGCDLAGARFDNADLRGTTFSDIDNAVTASFSNVQTDDQTKLPN